MRAMRVGEQDWSDLLFLHWRVPALDLRDRVPARLSIDQRDGSAWVSMTPFTLRNGRLRGLPPLPDFHELNFRTYVTLPGHGSGSGSSASTPRTRSWWPWRG